MRTNRRWLASVAALLGLTLTCNSGCQTVMGGMTLPSPRYLEHYPQYFAPDPSFPLPRELASQEDPEGAARRGGPVLGGPAPAAPANPAPVGGR
ncbi:hypothetical protein VT84_10505 [Gemmata sp. SH-PL17]|uniref:hypothetical protein n=1 Tax=Gemmata sp. SH-PL17 TaxID=1630693 RepID=UPI00078EA56D|nr:hypothetical protein [Gemmata sp. SH-PL17]AMV24818.1 hypothetical protein VT84_10505 [Gemmata sp. SH-PL17]